MIELWSDRDISAGGVRRQEVDRHLNEAQVILLLVSPDFLVSEYASGTELKRALERCERGEVCVIPVIVRRVHWEGVLGHLQALPKDERPIMEWPNRDRALYSVAEGLRNVVIDVGRVWTVAWSPDGKHIASAGEDIAVHVWDANTGDNLLVHHSDGTPVASVAWSPDNKQIVSSNDQTIEVWDARTDDGPFGVYKRDQAGHIFGVVWSPDGRWLASANLDGTARIWDMSKKDGSVREYQTRAGELYAVAWSPDSKRFVVATERAGVCIWGI